MKLTSHVAVAGAEKSREGRGAARARAPRRRHSGAPSTRLAVVAGGGVVAERHEPFDAPRLVAGDRAALAHVAVALGEG